MTNKHADVKISFNLTSVQKYYIDKLCEEKGISISDLIRRCLDETLIDFPEPETEIKRGNRSNPSAREWTKVNSAVLTTTDFGTTYEVRKHAGNWTFEHERTVIFRGDLRTVKAGFEEWLQSQD